MAKEREQKRSPGLSSGAEMDIDRLMETFTQPHAHRIAKSPLKDKRLDVRDCLATDTQAGLGVPSYTSRSPAAASSRGWTLAGRHGSPKRFLGKGLVAQATHSPGPIYQPRAFTDAPSRPQSFPRGRRRSHTGPRDSASPGPGARYDIPSTLHGADKTRSASPSCKFGTADRFKGKEFISAQHSKVAGPGSDVPGPQQYFANGQRAKNGPEYSFGHPDGGAPRARFNSRVFISRMHAGVSGGNHAGPAPGIHQTDNSGKDPESFSRAVSSQAKRAPQWTIGGGFSDAARAHVGVDSGGRSADDSPRICQARFISAEHSAKDGPAKDSHLTPGPGSYHEDDRKENEKVMRRTAESRALDCVKKRPPSHSFGALTDTSKLYAANAFSADAKGRTSPGPCYNPDAAVSQVQAPSYSFGDPDPDVAGWKNRFEDVRYVGGGIGMRAGVDSPGPAEYEVTDLPQGPAFSIARRERMTMKRICPSPEHARFISKELSKENFGAYSPGPKYSIAGTMGSAGVSKSPYGTFGLSDREWADSVPQDVREKTGTAVKPYTTPGEARFISRKHAEANKGRCSPGPIYNPAHSVVKEKAAVSPHLQDGSLGQTSPQRVVQSVLSTHRTAPAVSIGGKAERLPPPDLRDSNPTDRLTRRSSPGFGFGTASRSGVGPCSQGPEASKADKKKEQIEVSPGPGSFTPNYTSVEQHTPGFSLGGLAEGYSIAGAAALRRGTARKGAAQ
eukprot:TRINITY_DN19511_c0_g1_i1.p1 TRINITY_DN19511_c0_g1~~TRINITY_DN19511_c0_g1_i1.p1  ORF type:complete len:751 (+),score=151.10 TRINITY_DN19511_c0_g1_i1:61-2253(+)